MIDQKKQKLLKKMIPQAIANTGIYSDLWSQFKSMDHALQRVKSAESIKQIAELDKSRLIALSEFLKQELNPKEGTDELTFEAFLLHRSTEFKYSLDSDLRSVLQELPTFKEWLRSQKLSFKEKAERLITALDDHVGKVKSSFFPKPPEEEFSILHDLLCKLLSQTESALVS